MHCPVLSRLLQLTRCRPTSVLFQQQVFWARFKTWIRPHLLLTVIAITLLFDQFCMMLIISVVPLYLLDHQTNANGTGTGTDWLSAGATLHERHGLIVATKGFIQTICSLFLTGPITHRFGYRDVLICGLLGMISSCQLFAIGTTMLQFVTARAIQGISSSLVNAAGLSLLAEHYRDVAKRDTAMGTAMCAMCIGYAFGPPFASTLYDFGGKTKELPFYISAGLMSVVVIMVHKVVPRNASRQSTMSRSTSRVEIKQTNSIEPVHVKKKLMEFSDEEHDDKLIQNHHSNNNNNNLMIEPPPKYDDSISTGRVSPASASHGTGVLSLLYDRYVALCLTDIIISCLPVSVLEAVLTIYMNEHIQGVTDVAVGVVWLPSSAAMITATYMTTIIMRRHPCCHPEIIQCALLLECVACAVLPLQATVLGISGCLCALMFGDLQVETAVVPLIGHIIDQRYGADGHYGSGYALWDMAYSSVETVGPVLGAMAVARIGFSWFMAFVALVTAVMIPMNRRLRGVMSIGEIVEHEKTHDGHILAL